MKKLFFIIGIVLLECTFMLSMEKEDTKKEFTLTDFSREIKEKFFKLSNPESVNEASIHLKYLGSVDKEFHLISKNSHVQNEISKSLCEELEKQKINTTCFINNPSRMKDIACIRSSKLCVPALIDKASYISLNFPYSTIAKKYVKSLIQEDAEDIKIFHNENKQNLMDYYLNKVIEPGKKYTAFYFLKNGFISINDFTKQGFTALMCAAHNERESIVKSMLAYPGINVLLYNNSRLRALDIAKKMRKKSANCESIYQCLKEATKKASALEKENQKRIKQSIISASNSQKLKQDKCAIS